MSGQGESVAKSEVAPPTLRLPFVRRFLKRFAGLVVDVFYRRVDLVGSPPAPDRAAILAVNHTNGLADSVVIVGRAPAFPRFLAAASWWKFAPARWLFDLAGVLPVHRQREGEDTRENTSSFAACEEALSEGAQIAIHPEGEMHPGIALLPLRTGAARIALAAAAGATPDLVVVPYAIVYEDRGRFRSDAALNIGAPLSVAAWVDGYRQDPESAVRDLTEAIAGGLRSVTANHESAHGASVVDAAAVLALRAADEPAERESGYGRRHELIRRLAVAVDAGGGETGESFRELEAAADAHRADLGALGVEPDDWRPVLEPFPADERDRRARELGALTPAALVGAVLNAPVASGLAVASRFVRGEGWQATTKGALGVVLAPIVWGVEAATLARITGRRSLSVIVVMVGAPLGGWALLAWLERWKVLRASAWRERIARRDPAALEAALASRARVGVVVESILANCPDGDHSAVRSPIVIAPEET